MAFVTAAAITGGGALLGGLGGAIISGNAANNAAQTQAAAADRASQLQYQMYQQQRQDQQPWMQAGAAALPKLSQLASTAPSFTAQDFQNNMDPAYQFDLQEGQKALERSAAAQGGLQSGGTLKALTKYAQGAASNEYQNAYSRYMNNQNTQFNRLASVAGLGQTANAQNAASGTNYANAVGSNMTGAANAAGAAQIASGNAWGSTLSGLSSGIGNNYMQANMLSHMFPQTQSLQVPGYSMPQIGSQYSSASPNLGLNLSYTGT